MLAAPDETLGDQSQRRDPVHGLAAHGACRSAPSDPGPPRRDPHQPAAETLHLLSLVEITDLLNGCSPAALVRNAFVLLRMVATARYLHLKSQELHEALMEAHETIGYEVEEKVRFRGAAPAVDASAHQVALLTDQLADMSTKYQEALASRVGYRLAPRSDRVRNDLITALAQDYAQVADLGDQLKASVATEREASTRRALLTCLSARLQQQLDSSRANDERLSVPTPASVDKGVDHVSAVPVQPVIIVGCAGGQRIIIVHEPSGSHVDGQYQPDVCRIWRQRRPRHPSRKPRVTGKFIHSFHARRWFARLRDQRVGHRVQSLMERVPVPNWKVGWEVSTILEALRECYPLVALDNLVSTYDKWYTLYKSMRTTITVDQNNIALIRKQFSEQLISALADFGDLPADSPTSITLARIMAPTDCS